MVETLPPSYRCEQCQNYLDVNNVYCKGCGIRNPFYQEYAGVEMTNQGNLAGYTDPYAQTSNQPIPQTYQQPYQQNEFNQEGMVYPTSIDPEMQKQIEKDEKENMRKAANAPLNAVPELRGDTERQRFVIKVYTICMCMLGITTALTYAAFVVSEFRDFMGENPWTHWVSLIFGVGLMCTLACCRKVARKVPINYILLFLFTACWSFMVAGFTIYYEPEIVLAAAALTMFMFVGLTALACFTPTAKLGYCWAIASVLGACVFPMVIFFIFFPTQIMFILICLLVVVLTSIYIVYDTKMIMEYLDTDEYIIGALFLYVDLIQLFMYILALFGNN